MKCIINLMIVCACVCACVSAEIKVAVKRKPADSRWKYYDTQTLDDLGGYQHDDVRLDKFGGLIDGKFEASGYFHVRKLNDRWWLIDPLGNRFIHIGVCSVNCGRSDFSRSFMEENFGDEKAWAKWTNSLLYESGFNGTGAWSDTEILQAEDNRLVYTLTWNFMGSFGRSKKLTVQESGHLGYPEKVIPVFHPDFETFCIEYAKSAEKTRNDPYLLGHFSDNELPVQFDMLDRSLKLDKNHPDLKYGYLAAEKWLKARKGPAGDLKHITDSDRKAFLYMSFDRYFRITTSAMRKYDPEHLCLGPRLYGGSLRKPEIMAAAGNHLDVIAINYYGAWTPDQNLMDMWVSQSRRPFLITEWYAKGQDSGMANNTGAGWLVKTQSDRGRFYQNFTLGLLRTGNCVGWHWFKYRDNNPLDASTDPSNRDSNKGIVNYEFKPYRPLLDMMKDLNRQVYSIIGYYDSN